MFCNTDESDEEEARYLRLLVERQVDGVLLVPAENAAASLRLLRTHKIPVVVLDRRASRRVDNVRCDSEAGAYALASHLIELGHRRIAVLTGRRGISTSVDRVAGVRRALAEAGLTLDESLVRYGGFNFGNMNLADGRRMAREVLAATDDAPTAIFAANNFIAFGAVRALRELGLRVPDDVSVVAFDDLPAEWVDRAVPHGRRAARLRDRASRRGADDRPPASGSAPRPASRWCCRSRSSSGGPPPRLGARRRPVSGDARQPEAVERPLQPVRLP